MKFTADMFLGHDMSPQKGTSRYGLERFQAERIADIANAKVSELLERIESLEAKLEFWKKVAANKLDGGSTVSDNP